MDEPHVLAGAPTVTRRASVVGPNLAAFALALVLGGIFLFFFSGMSSLVGAVAGIALTLGALLALVAGVMSVVGLFGDGRRGYASIGVGVSLIALLLPFAFLLLLLWAISEAFG